MADNKDKKVLNVPALRFPEFTEEWEEHYLAEYLDFKNGLNPSANKFGSGIKFISVMDILNNDFITYDCIRTSVEITPEEQVAFAVEKGDMLFQRSSETLEDVGRANVYMDDRPAVFGGFVIRGKKKAEYNPMFFRYLLASPYARKKVIPMGGDTYGEIDSKQFHPKLGCVFPEFLTCCHIKGLHESHYHSQSQSERHEKPVIHGRQSKLRS